MWDSVFFEWSIWTNEDQKEIEEEFRKLNIGNKDYTSIWVKFLEENEKRINIHAKEKSSFQTDAFLGVDILHMSAHKVGILRFLVHDQKSDEKLSCINC